MNKCVLILCFFLIGVPGAFSQSFTQKELKYLRQKEDSLTRLGEKIIDEEDAGERLRADSLFTRVLVRTLQSKKSFYFPLDSLYTISRLYAPDSSFRIITWQIKINENNFRQHGAIQMKTEDGSLKLFPLIDYSDAIQELKDSITDHLHWPGAVYYKIIQKDFEGRRYYTLLGYDEYNERTNRKMMEILYFENGMPRFGRNCFVPERQARHIMEYKKSAGPRLNYDEELDIIILENLVSSSGEPFKKYTLVGDGDYDAYRWQNGQWILTRKIFRSTTPEAELPVPAPFLEDKLNMETPQESPNEKVDAGKKSPASGKRKSKSGKTSEKINR